MIIHYCDPALTSRTGHHYQWAISYLDALKRSYDVEVHTWIGKDATPECVAALQAFGPVNLHFSLRPYSVRRFLLKDPVGGSLQFFMEGSQLLASELRRMPAADLTFWITLFPYQLHAMATAGT